MWLVLVIIGTTPTALWFRGIVHPGLARNEPTLGYQKYNAYSVGPHKYDFNALVVGYNMCNVCGVEPCKYDFNALVVGCNTCNVCGVEPFKRRSDRFEVLGLIRLVALLRSTNGVHTHWISADNLLHFTR